MSADILVIEDNPTNMELMELLLTSHGYGFMPALDGDQGLDAARRAKPDLIVCDIHLPRRDGYGVLAELKCDAMLRFVPVVAVSALAMVGDREKLLAAGFDGYISKPIDPETFIDQIEQFLPSRLRSRVSPEAIPDTDSGTLQSAQGPRVLLVDDAADGRAELESTLDSLDFQVLSCASAGEALACIQDAEIDLVLCDIMMPRHDGWDLLATLKKDPALSAIPVVLITVTPREPDEQRRALAAGAAALLHRPIDPAQLASTLRRCLADGAAGTTP